MELEGRDLGELPLEQRRAQLKRLLGRSKGNLIRYSDSFPDPIVLLAECIRLGLEGIVCKRKDTPYRSGSRSGWIKILWGRRGNSTGGRGLLTHRWHPSALSKPHSDGAPDAQAEA